MAEVFKAKSYGVEGFEKIIAIKRILPTMGEDRDFIKMFIDEAKIAGQLAHANICQIFELGRIDGSHFIAMEYIWGKDLLQIQNRLRKTKTPMPIPMSCFCIAKVLEGLDYAHRKRDPLGRPLEIVHRDCSPQNVLVSYEGEVKVIDFGIAKATSRNSRTMAGVLKGKFGYMSPEQVRGLPLDRRSDIFAIGTMLYECLTGERLFQGETDFSTLEKVRNVDIQAPRSINPQIPEAIEKIILKALAKDVDDRYQWCSEMLADLQQFLMAQDVVFTAKSLSSWLKEVFQADIERERGLLEQYKRVGRDGLIQGAPAAEAKLDVNEHLGEAGKPEGDATMLGGPNFDDMEHGVGATPDVNQSPVGGPRSSVNAPIGQSGKKTPGPSAAAKPAPNFSVQRSQRRHEDEDADGEGDFGEEAPTEIFGDDMPTESPMSTPQPARPNTAPVGKKNTPTGRPATERPGSTPAPVLQQPMAAAPAPAPYTPPAANPYPTNQPYGSTHGPIGTPPGPQAAMGGHPQQEGPQRTVLGMAAPQLPNYANYRPSQQTPAAQPNVAPQQPYPSYPQQPQQQYGGYPQQPNFTPPGQYMGYPGSGQMQMPPQMGAATPVDHLGNPINPMNMTGGMMPMVEGKKSTLARDIAIGVGIAALVLVGFLVVKMVVLDKGDSTAKDTTATSKLANVKIKMPQGMTAEMTVDGARVATVENGKEIAVSAGMKHIKLVGNNGLSCDDERVKLESGKTTLLECGFGGGTAATGSGSAAGSAAAGSAAVGAGSAAPVTEVKAQGSAAVATGSGAGSGSAAMVATKTETKPVETKTETKPVETKTETKTTTTGTGAGSAAKTETKTNPTTTATKTDTKSTGTTTKTDTKTSGGTQTVKTDTKSSGGSSTKTDPTKGYLQVYSKPTAHILVDGQETNLKTPISGHALPLSPGKHKITFVIGDDRFTYPVMVKAGSTETMSKDLQ